MWLYIVYVIIGSHSMWMLGTPCNGKIIYLFRIVVSHRVIDWFDIILVMVEGAFPTFPSIKGLMGFNP